MVASLLLCSLAASGGEPRAATEAGFTPLFNGKDLSGWVEVGKQDWHVEKGFLWTEGKGGWLRSERRYADFIWRLEYRTTPKSNSGIFIRSDQGGNPAFTGFEVQILDDAGHPPSVHGSGAIYGAAVPSENAAKPAGEWNQAEISVIGRRVVIVLNGKKIEDVDLDNPRFAGALERPLSKVPSSGFLGLQSHTNRVEFRNLRIKVLKPAP